MLAPFLTQCKISDHFAGGEGVRDEPAEGAGGGGVAMHRREQRALLRLRRRRQDGQGTTRLNAVVAVVINS